MRLNVKMGSAIGLLVLAVVLLATLSGCKRSGIQAVAKSGADSGATAGPRQPAVTPVGTPAGTAASTTIGLIGGTLKSTDSRLILSVPPGAFPSDTAVSIVPVSNTAPNGAGPTYRLMPEGTTFAQPVTLAWQLSPKDLAGGSLDDFLIVSQTSDGKWMAQSGVKRDAATNKLSVSVSHFSDWATVQTLFLVPREAKIDTGGDVWLRASMITRQEENPLYLDQGINYEWAVDGNPNGNYHTGTIISEHVSSDDRVFPAIVGHYLAPLSIPARNPVRVSISVQAGSRKVIAFAYITIIPLMESWVGTSEITQLDGSQVSSNFRFEAKPLESLSRFDVQSGHVHWSPPKQAGDCRLSVAPQDHDIDPKEGNLTVQYQQAGGGVEAQVTGGGTTVWLATYTTHCPDGSSKSFQAPASAMWWPVDPYQSMSAITVSTRKDNSIPVNGMMGKGVVHLRKAGVDPQPTAQE